MNVRYLAGLACPACGASGTFTIDATAPMVICDNLVDHIDMDSLAWSDDARCRCSACLFTGAIKEFKEGFRIAVVSDVGDALLRLCNSPNAARGL